MAITDCAATILDQIGGVNRLQVMLGASKVLTDTEAITFDFKMSRKFNHCRITYCSGPDLYRVEFLKYNRKTFETKTVQSFEMVYADQLRSIF